MSRPYGDRPAVYPAPPAAPLPGYHRAQPVVAPPAAPLPGYHQAQPVVAPPAAPLPGYHSAVPATGPRFGGQSHGKDGHQIAAESAAHLDYRSQLARRLGVPDPVEEYFAPVVGKWDDLHAEAERWRHASRAAEQMTSQLTASLGGLDAAWQGQDATTFVQHMQQVCAAGKDMSDATMTMAIALELTADGIRQVVSDLADTLVRAAEVTSAAATVPVGAEQRVRGYLDELHRPTAELFEAVRDILEAFRKLCDGVQGHESLGDAVFGAAVMKHHFPDQNWTFTDPTPKPPATPTPKVDPTAAPAPTLAASAPDLGGAGIGGAGIGGGGIGGAGIGGAGVGAGVGASGGAGSPPQPGMSTFAQEPHGADAPARAGGAAAPAAKAGPGGGGMGGGMMPMGAMGAHGGGGGEQEHKPKSRVQGSVTDIFGKPIRTAPPVLGDEEE